MVVIGVFCNVLIGYSARSPKAESTLLLVLPLIVAVAFFLIADIESPRQGLIPCAPPESSQPLSVPAPTVIDKQ